MLVDPAAPYGENYRRDFLLALGLGFVSGLRSNRLRTLSRHAMFPAMVKGSRKLLERLERAMGIEPTTRSL